METKVAIKLPTGKEIELTEVTIKLSTGKEIELTEQEYDELKLNIRSMSNLYTQLGDDTRISIYTSDPQPNKWIAGIQVY